ncbi:hypothetical protein QCA50_010040 [Cerrena zonata]|uniref:Uncharacterized protein n=1 Tax=Cerrena zonata TaxID=2478898 RepID=A0AAW0G681_9APHY
MYIILNQILIFNIQLTIYPWTTKYRILNILNILNNTLNNNILNILNNILNSILSNILNNNILNINNINNIINNINNTHPHTNHLSNNQTRTHLYPITKIIKLTFLDTTRIHNNKNNKQKKNLGTFFQYISTKQ